jgi:hypothetical protein
MRNAAKKIGFADTAVLCFLFSYQNLRFGLAVSGAQGWIMPSTLGFQR